MEHITCQKIKQYGFFDYSAYEALFLSEKENAIINEIIQNIQQEYQSNIDKFSKLFKTNWPFRPTDSSPC